MTSFRLPDATRLGAVTLQVSDLVRSVDYYERVIGMRVVDRTGRGAHLAAQGDDRALIELIEHKHATPVPKRGRLGLYHFAVLLPDRASLGRFLVHLDDLGLRAGMSDHLVSEALYLNDPDGLGIEVYRDRPAGEWRRIAGQIEMATKPLDAAAVAAAASGEKWTGMPAGTCIGHVHLHVGDIGEGSSFYSDGLGFEKTVWSYPGALFMSAGGYHHHLGINTWAAGASPANAVDARLLHWELIVPTLDDAAAAAGSLRTNGHEVTMGDNHWLATDPWGTTVRMVAASR